MHEIESGDDNLQVGTCSIYLSGAKEFVKIKVPPLIPFGRITIPKVGGKIVAVGGILKLGCQF